MVMSLWPTFLAHAVGLLWHSLKSEIITPQKALGLVCRDVGQPELKAKSLDLVPSLPKTKGGATETTHPIS